MSKGPESGPALLDEWSHEAELSHVGALAWDALEDASKTRDELWPIFKELEDTLLKAANRPDKIPGEDQAYGAYVKLAQRIDLEIEELKVGLNDGGHIQRRT